MASAEQTQSPSLSHENDPTKIGFLSTNTGGDWLSIEPDAPAGASPDEVKIAEQRAKIARKQLAEYLHSVLTTPHVIVLAGSGTSLGKVGGPSMNDLWNAVTNIRDFEKVRAAVKHPSDDDWIENLLSRCRMAAEFLDTDPAKTVLDFLSAAEKMIWTACSQFLEKADLHGHETFLRRMARRRLRAPRIKLFTTNYDLCFEAAAGNLGLIAIDGFSFSQPRRFDPRFFNYDVVRRAKGSDETHDFVEGLIQIFKLHGSVNWDNTPKGIVQSAEPAKPCLIYPCSSKYEQSYSQPHLELMSQFQAALREPNTCLITIGFGFNDNHLLAPVIAAVNSNPSFKLLAISPSAKSESEQTTGTYSALRDMIGRGEADIALLNGNFEQFAELIPHLRALSPAEQIERSVKQIASES
jgi:hypothetical protein